jgi:hypothetical protein
VAIRESGLLVFRQGCEYDDEMRKNGRLHVLFAILTVVGFLLFYEHYKEFASAKARADEEATRSRLEGLLADLPSPPASVPPKVPKSIAKVLEAATEIKVISLDPFNVDRSKFVLGSVVVKDRDTIAMIRDAIYQSIAQGNGHGDCYDPRHAIEAHAGELVLDLEICFACAHGGGGIRHTHFNGSLDVGSAGKGILNEVLSAAGIPLSPN